MHADLSTARLRKSLGVLFIGAYGLGCTPQNTAAEHLPEPELWRVPLPVFSAEQKRRKDEIDAYLAQRYQEAGWRIIVTTQTYEGDIVDWVDPLSVEGSQEEPPPPPEIGPLPEGAELQRMELEVFPELRGPDDTMPMLRPDYAAYVLEPRGAKSLDEWLETKQAVGAPLMVERLYAGFISKVENTGASAFINAYGGAIEANTMSLMEMGVGCLLNGEVWQFVGIAASRDNINLKDKWEVSHPADSVLRLQVEFLTAGPLATGSQRGGWDINVGGFRGPDGFNGAPGWRPYAPGTAFATSTLSTVGGTQFESLYHIRLWQNKWWVGHNGHWLGYYKTDLFVKIAPTLLAIKGCEVHYYGEIGALSKTPWTKTDMGSGEYAEKAFPYAAYFRTPSYYGTDAAATLSQISTDPQISQNAGPYIPACYSRSALGIGSTPDDLAFFASGPGGDEPTCQVP